MENTIIRNVQESDKPWIQKVVAEEFGSSVIIARGKKYIADSLLGFVAEINNEKVGLATYVVEDNECELISLNSLKEGKGIGTHLIEKVRQVALENSCKRLVVTTTNDNTDALKFYQRRGFHLIKIYPNAIQEARKLKPEIPELGNRGIPIRDVIELEIIL